MWNSCAKCAARGVASEPWLVEAAEGHGDDHFGRVHVHHTLTCGTNPQARSGRALGSIAFETRRRAAGESSGGDELEDAEAYEAGEGSIGKGLNRRVGAHDADPTSPSQLNGKILFEWATPATG